MKHKKRKIVTTVLCFILMINSFSGKVQASPEKDSENVNQVADTGDWPEGPSITAGAAVVMDVETGLVLYEKNSTEKNYPASITKILTSLVAIENSSLSDTVLFSKNAVFSIEKGSSSCAIDWGEELSMEDCLYGILLESGNDVSNAVAEHVGGTIDDFVEMMNTKSKELGCVNSHFANPHGLSDDAHYTCAYDMALISRAAIKNSTFATITGTRRHIVEPTNKQPETRYWLNHHYFVNKKLEYDGCIGGKTGYTYKSKYTLVTFAKRGDMTLVCVIMNEENAANQYTETANLLDFGFENFSIYHMSDAEHSELLQNSIFFNQYNSVLSEQTPLLSVSEDAYVILPNGVDLSMTQREVNYYDRGDEEEASFLKEIGTVTYQYANRIIGQGKVMLDLTESQLPITIHKAIEIKEGTRDDSETSISSVNQDAANITEFSGKEDKPNLKPIIAIVIAGTVIILLLIYYFTVERPRRRRRKAYLEHRKNHRY